MQLPSPIAMVASATHHAALIAMPAVPYRKRDIRAMQGWPAEKRLEAMRNNTVPEKDALRRPSVDECEVFAMFSQTWGSTALGYGGLGGAAMTPAYTVVVRGPLGHFVVYWNGRPAYIVDPSKQTPEQQQAFAEDLQNRWTEGVLKATGRYGATSIE